MKSKLLIVIIICFLLLPYTVFSAEETSPIDQLNYLSDEALQLTKSHRYEDAKKILETFSDKFSTVTVSDQNFTMDELRIVTIAHNEAVEATTNASMDPDERINRVTKLRLVIDAISSTKQPLWTEMKEPMLTVFNEVKTAALNGEREVFNERLNSFLALYEVVYPSMKIDVSAERIQKLDTRINFVDQYRVEILNDIDARQELLVLEIRTANDFRWINGR